MDILRQIFGVAFVFLLLGFALWKLRGGGAGGLFRAAWISRDSWTAAKERSRNLQQIDKLMLTPQHAVHLLQVNGEQMLVATHPQGCVLLSGSRKSEARA